MKVEQHSLIPRLHFDCKEEIIASNLSCICRFIAVFIAIHLASQIALSCHDIATMDPNSQYSSGLSGFPALLPPPGVSSDFIHPKSIGHRVTIASTICLTLMTLCVIVRFYTKLFIKHVWGWDDCEPLFHCKLNLLMASRFLYTCNGKERCRGFYSHPSQM